MTFDDTGKTVVRIMHRTIIQTTANILWWCEGRDKRFMTKLVHLPASANSKCFIIEGDGYLLYNDAVTEFESEVVGQYREFKFQNNSE